MAKFKIITLMVVLALMCKVYAAAPKDGAKEENAPGGMELLKKDEELIKTLEDKNKESGGNNPVIAELETLAKEMKELNNQRHQMHAATEQYAKAFSIFSKGVEENIAKVNQVVEAQADAAIDADKTKEKNAKLKALLENGQEPPSKKQKTE